MKSFRSIALLEGISTLALYFFAMPMKYIAGDPIYVKNIGMAHGVLFMLYIAFAILNKNSQMLLKLLRWLRDIDISQVSQKSHVEVEKTS